MKVKATRIISLNKGVFNKDISHNNPVIFCAIIMLGIITGVVIQTLNSDLYQQNSQKLDEFLQINTQKGFFDIFAGNFAYNLIFIILPMFFGLCAAGFVLVYAIPFFKGLGIGATCAMIYSTYTLKGIGYCLIIVFPIALIQFIAIILSCSESFQMSTDMMAVLRKENTAEEEIKINLFFLRYLIITVIMLFSSVMYALCNQLFFKLLA